MHLSYCSNVHPAEDLDGIRAQLARYAGPVREATGFGRLGLGLWLPAGPARELARDPGALERLRSALSQHHVEVVTLNGFPYGGFHAPVVKKAVYRPDWSEPERLAYTLDLANVLAGLLPDDVPAGSISTLPFGWREGWSDASTKSALVALEHLVHELEALRERTGRTIRLGFEPEPGCIVERTGQATKFLGGTNGEAPVRTGAGATAPLPAGPGVDRRWVGVCLDACHLAVEFEDPSAAVAALGHAGVPIVKAQLSTALRVPDSGKAEASAALETYVEPRFMHQTRQRGSDGQITRADDLDDALAGALSRRGEWRVHFHAPVHWEGNGPGQETTQPELRRTLDALVGGPEPQTTHLDVETYTWTVLPPGRRPSDDAGLVEGLARELLWTRDRLVDLGLKEAV